MPAAAKTQNTRIQKHILGGGGGGGGGKNVEDLRAVLHAAVL
jgi:hypothetical protein